MSEGVLDIEGDAFLVATYHITFHVKPSNEGEGKDGQNLKGIKVDIETCMEDIVDPPLTYPDSTGQPPEFSGYVKHYFVNEADLEFNLMHSQKP